VSAAIPGIVVANPAALRDRRVRPVPTTDLPGVPALGDKASKWRPAPDLKVDVCYGF
jgi:hypothetical protein